MQPARDAYRAPGDRAKGRAHARLFRLGRRHALVQFFGRRAGRQQRDVILRQPQRAQLLDRLLGVRPCVEDTSHSFHPVNRLRRRRKQTAAGRLSSTVTAPRIKPTTEENLIGPRFYHEPAQAETSKHSPGAHQH
jgi:hypothetical protein